MQTDFWLEKWQKNQIGFHEKEVNDHLVRFWKELGVPSGSKVFVPFCGKSKDIIWLLSQGYEVLAVELSPIAVKDFFSENNLEPQITQYGDFQRWESEGLCVYQGDFFDLSAEDLQECTVIYDRASLIALPLDMQQRYVNHLSGITHKVKQTLLVTLEYSQQEMQGPPFSVNNTEVHQMFAEACHIECLLEQDILEQNEKFSKRGLAELIERVYVLKKQVK